MSSTIAQSYGGVGGAGPGREFIATGAIPEAGMFVSLRSDGTVEVTQQANPAIGAGSQYQVATAVANNYASVATNGNGTIVVAYSNATDVFIKAGTVVGTVITFGAAQTLGSASGNKADAVVYDPSQNVFIAAFKLSNVGKVRALTVAGTTITLGGTTYNVNSTDACGNMRLVYVPAQSRSVVVFEDQTGTAEITAAAVTASGTTLTVGALVVIFSGTSNLLAVGYSSSADKILAVYRVSGNCVVRMLTLAVSTLTLVGAQTNVFTGANRGSDGSIVDILSNKVVISNDGSNAGVAFNSVVGTISGTTISFGSTYSTGYVNQSDHDLTYVPTINKIVLTLRDPSDSFLKMKLASISGTVLSWGAEVTIISAAQWSVAAALDLSLDKLVVANVNQSQVGQATIVDPEAGSSNLATWIGVAQSAAANGELVSVKLPGEIDENQSGLVPGTEYYLSETGALITTQPNPSVGKVATALTSTAIQLWKTPQ